MHFIFGYQKEIPVKIEGKASKTALVVLAVLIISLFIFLSFENLDEETQTSPVIFDGLTHFAWQGLTMNGIQSWVEGAIENSRFKMQNAKFEIQNLNLEF